MCRAFVLSVAGWRHSGDGVRDGFETEALAAIFKHGFSARGANAADPDCTYREKGVQIADASCGLDLHARGRVFAHQFEIGKGCSAGRVAG